LLLKDARDTARLAMNQASADQEPTSVRQDRKQAETFEGKALQWLGF
jgi:hypothetical protein